MCLLHVYLFPLWTSHWSSHDFFCVIVDEFLTPIFFLPLVNKEEVVQKARPVSTDVGSTNPNFSDLMDEFIQERLKANGTGVSTRSS